MWTDAKTDRSVVLDTSIKLSALGSQAPDDRVLFPKEWSAVGLARVRLSLGAKLGKLVDTELAYEHRARRVSHADASGAGSGILPAEAEAPYRVWQLDDDVVDGSDRFTYRHELDRVLAAFHPSWGEVVVGRQAIGLGRGVVFGAVDLFNPFSPTEVDREWRRGVDALRCEVRLSDTSSIEALAVFGESWADSAWLVRLRGYLGRFDGELLAGKRGRDAVFGGVLSGALFGAEVHAEVAVFDTPETWSESELFGQEHLVGKAVLGASYTFGVGTGLTLVGEYHYSGFGVENIETATLRLADPDYQARFLRGDTQILGQHALALQLSHLFTEAWSGALLVLTNPVDGSGLVSPSAKWDMNEHTSLHLSGFLPWGASPENGQLKSEHGASSRSLFAQLSMYF